MSQRHSPFLFVAVLIFVIKFLKKYLSEIKSYIIIDKTQLYQNIP